MIIDVILLIIVTLLDKKTSKNTQENGDNWIILDNLDGFNFKGGENSSHSNSDFDL